MRILSSAEKCRRVARRIFFTTSVAGSFSGTDFCLIFAPCEGYDEPEILPSSTHMAARGACAAADDAGGRICQCRIVRCTPCCSVPQGPQRSRLLRGPERMGGVPLARGPVRSPSGAHG